MRQIVFRTVLCVSLILSLNFAIQSRSLQAGETDPTMNASLKSRYIFNSDPSAGSGHLSVNESRFDFSKDFKIRELPLTVGFTYRETGINENLDANLPSRLVAEEFQLGTRFPLPFMDSEHYFVGVDIFPSMYTDSGDFTSSAFRIPFRTYLIYKKDENFILVLGVKIRPEFDSVAIPVIGLIYKPNDRLTFNLASSDPSITYKIDDKLTALVELNENIDEYEVTRNGQEGVVFKFNESSVGGGFKYAFTKNIEAQWTTGGVFGRYMEYRDKVDKTVPDAGIYTSFKLSAKF